MAHLSVEAFGCKHPDLICQDSQIGVTEIFLIINYNTQLHTKVKKNILTLAAVLIGIGQAMAQEVQFFAPNIVRVQKSADAPTDKGQPSLVVIARPQKVKVARSVRGGETVYESSLLKVTVRDGIVTFKDKKGNVIMTDAQPRFTAISTGPDRGAYRVAQAFSVDADEGIYGIGMMQNGKMSQRGEDRRMEQSNLDDYTHFYQSVKGYGVYWDNYSPTRLKTPAEGKAGELLLESEVGQKVDYYFIYGATSASAQPDADGVIKAMRHLTGHAPMLPLWTYGFHQSRERYKSQDELLDVVRNYRRLGIPFDGIIQDWQYWGSNYTWNAMDFLNTDFGKAQDMIDEVHRQHAHMSISIWQSFGPETLQFRELKDKGLLFGFETWPRSGLGFWPPRMEYPSHVRVMNPYSDEARDIYWRYLSKMHGMGIDAWWMDSTDPDHHSYQDSDLDETCLIGQTGTTERVSYRSVRNAFPLMAVGGVYDHQRAADSTRRVFILTRSFFAGQQRYGANTWSGDIGSSWDSFRKQIPLCLNHTLTANPQVNTDIGGFFAGTYNKIRGEQKGPKHPQFQELYVRWMQFGAFCPMMRSHGTEVPRELYLYGHAGEPVYDALVDAVRLRYRFLPYIYSLSWQVSRHDDSFMRALFMDFKADRKTWNNSRQYMFGHNIFVCPVLDPLYTPEKRIDTDALTGWDNAGDAEMVDGQIAVNWSAPKTYDAYLPAGTRWYDYWTDAIHDGGQTVTCQAPLSRSPLFVKAGTILPQGPDVQYADIRDWQTLDITVYPGVDAEFTLYEDEGDNYNYEKGAYSTIRMVWNDKSRTLTIGKRLGSFAGMHATRTFNVRVAGSCGAKSVSYDGATARVKL